MYGTFPKAFFPIVKQFVDGKTVVDLGSGDGERAEILRKLGATVVMVDKDSCSPDVVKLRFEDMKYQILHQYHHDVIHLAWPSNWRTGVEDLLYAAPVVIYVGKNTEGSACGTPALFDKFRQREVLAYVPRRQNTLIVYGAIQKNPRNALYLEEAAGMDLDEMWAYSDTLDAR